MSPENVLIAVTFSAGFAYLATRLVAAVWGIPRLAPRLRSVLELQKTPPRVAHPARSFDVWVLLALLLVLELTLARMYADAVSSRDVGGVVLTVGHFVFVFVWLVYVSRVTAKAS